MILWQSALCWRGEYPKGELSPPPSVRLANMHDMAPQLMVCSVEGTSYYRDWASLKTRLALPANYDALPPREHMRVLALCRAEHAALEDFLRLGARVDAMRSVAGSLRCFSSGINSYLAFCVLLGRPFLHPVEEAVILWASCFRPGRTYRNYIGRLKKACLLDESSLERYSAAVREIARGLRHAKKNAFKFPNFLYTQGLFTIINFL